MAGIGASAGGLAALEAFFAHMPADSGTGIALVLVQHLDPDHKSILRDLVGKCTQMKVEEVTDGTAVEPNRVYVIPPNKDMALLHGRLHLLTQPIEHRHSWRSAARKEHPSQRTATYGAVDCRRLLTIQTSGCSPRHSLPTLLCEPYQSRIITLDGRHLPGLCG